MIDRAGQSDDDGHAFVFRAVIYAVVFVIAVLPTVTLLQFCRTPENLVIAAALEMRRDGHWLMPTLEGELRTAKPPLATWVTALAIRSETVRAMSSTSPQARDQAARALAWETRWPAVVIAAFTLLATAELGRLLIGSGGGGIASMLFCGSGFLFLRFASEAATDTSLMLWVTVCNMLIAHAVLRNRRWIGCVGAGIALGLALMSKGPVALLQTVVPAIALIWWQRPLLASGVKWRWPLIVGSGCALLIAVPWPLAILLRDPSHQLNFWLKQLSGQDAPDRADPIWSYLVRLPEAVLPSIVLLAAGLWRGWRERTTGTMLAIVWLIVPIAIMTLFKDRKDRYLLPMIPAAAIICAIAIHRARSNDWAVRLHWIVLAVIGIGLPICSATPLLRAIDGRPWLAPMPAVVAAIISACVLAVAIATRRPVAGGTFAVMLITQFVFIIGYDRSTGGQSDMRPLARAIWAVAPDAEMINGQPTDIRTSVDLAIYMNRITRWMKPAEWRALPPGDRPRVVILLQEPNEPVPTADGWSVLSSVPHGKERWWALLLPRA